MSARLVSPELATRARALLDASETVAAAARRLGVSRATLRRAIAALEPARNRA